ncbi:MAG: hypothetical protein ACXV2E_07705, partial [Halobacteriota archaeon]
ETQHVLILGCNVGWINKEDFHRDLSIGKGAGNIRLTAEASSRAYRVSFGVRMQRRVIKSR